MMQRLLVFLVVSVGKLSKLIFNISTAVHSSAERDLKYTNTMFPSNKLSSHLQLFYASLSLNEIVLLQHTTTWKGTIFGSFII